MRIYLTVTDQVGPTELLYTLPELLPGNTWRLLTTHRFRVFSATLIQHYSDIESPIETIISPGLDDKADNSNTPQDNFAGSRCTTLIAAASAPLYRTKVHSPTSDF